VPVFDDRRSYWDPALPTAGVKERIRISSTED
jgi:hypothetical protein